MILYPYSTPLILTDEIYARLGGNIDTTPYDLRQMAYVIAESAVYYDLETPLTPTVFTGTYLLDSQILLDHAFIQNVTCVQILDGKNDVLHTVTGSSFEMNLLNAEYGQLLFNPYYACVLPVTYGNGPYHARAVYTAGLSSGTTYDPRILMALTQYATIQINEMIGYGNESTGDIGIDTFKTLDYFEKRAPLLRTAYGNSAKAQFIHHLLAPYRRRRHIGW